jgi:hypothetical protein
VKNIQDSKYSKAMEDVQTQKNALIKEVNAYVHKLSYDLNNKIKSIPPFILYSNIFDVNNSMVLGIFEFWMNLLITFITH